MHARTNASKHIQMQLLSTLALSTCSHTHACTQHLCTHTSMSINTSRQRHECPNEPSVHDNIKLTTARLRVLSCVLGGTMCVPRVSVSPPFHQLPIHVAVAVPTMQRLSNGSTRTGNSTVHSRPAHPCVLCYVGQQSTAKHNILHVRSISADRSLLRSLIPVCCAVTCVVLPCTCAHCHGMLSACTRMHCLTWRAPCVLQLPHCSPGP